MPGNAPSLKGFPAQNASGELVSSIPLLGQASSSSTTSFRTTTIPSITADDPELYMGDDCDAYYEATLLNSGLFDWLNQENTSLFHHPASQKRLEMLLLHLTCTDSAVIDGKKE
ncbi:hypothetical protein [Parasitella parasitica]|uniref:Uncharacterized protein n=1 Tax=Parasitella parasitica TaxID=35722 RepID=A0A0B7NEE4_9FUNG|nr:hypothetical protein [Parasitella parasitica]